MELAFIPLQMMINPKKRKATDSRMMETFRVKYKLNYGDLALSKLMNEKYDLVHTF